jgi:DNA-binding NarL/FixJ family response regulator
MAQGFTNQQIADRLSLSNRTVGTHVSRILGKLNLASRTAVVAYAMRHDLA